MPSGLERVSSEPGTGPIQDADRQSNSGSTERVLPGWHVLAEIDQAAILADHSGLKVLGFEAAHCAAPVQVDPFWPALLASLAPKALACPPRPSAFRRARRPVRDPAHESAESHLEVSETDFDFVPVAAEVAPAALVRQPPAPEPLAVSDVTRRSLIPWSADEAQIRSA